MINVNEEDIGELIRLAIESWEDDLYPGILEAEPELSIETEY